MPSPSPAFSAPPRASPARSSATSWVATAVLGFARSFDWRGVRFEEALRRFLDAFRLPGEAQKIYRVLDAWSVAFFEANQLLLRPRHHRGEEEEEDGTTAAAAKTAAGGDGQGEETPASSPSPSSAPPPTSSFPFASADAVHVLAFSAIMLNTDAHNARVRLKMTRAQFVRNNRGINGGGDLPAGMLEALYDSIVERPIRGPREAEAEGAGSCFGGGEGGGNGECGSSRSGSQNGGLVLGGGSVGGVGALARVASASWNSRGGGNGAARNGNGSSSAGGRRWRRRRQRPPRRRG